MKKSLKCFLNVRNRQYRNWTINTGRSDKNVSVRLTFIRQKLRDYFLSPEMTPISFYLRITRGTVWFSFTWKTGLTKTFIFNPPSN